MPDCVTLQDLDTSINCKDNTGGILKILAMYHSDVSAWPTEPVQAEATTLAAMGSLVGDLILKTGKKASVIVLPLNKGSYAITEVG